MGTVNVLKSTNKIDCLQVTGTMTKKIRSCFWCAELDGNDGIFAINSSDTTPISTDTVWAQLRHPDGSLFIKDGDNTLT